MKETELSRACSKIVVQNPLKGGMPTHKLKYNSSVGLNGVCAGFVWIMIQTCGEHGIEPLDSRKNGILSNYELLR
jgi:hypothetical protein